MSPSGRRSRSRFGEPGFHASSGAATGSGPRRRGLRAELGSSEFGPAVEERAARWAGVLLLALAVYIVVESGRRLLTSDRPGESVVGIVLMALSLIVMPLLARAKLRLAASLGSRALRADAHETIVCAWLSATTLLGLGLNAVLGWWWADPVAAVAMLPLIVREGIEAWRGTVGHHAC